MFFDLMFLVDFLVQRNKWLNMERNLKHLLLRKNVWGNALALKSKKVHCIFRGTYILSLLSSYVFLSLENPCILLLARGKTWKGTFNINRELSQNRIYRKTNHAFFDWKVGVFQQILVRVYCIFKHPEPEPLVFENIANHSDEFTKKYTNQRHLKIILTRILCGV